MISRSFEITQMSSIIYADADLTPPGTPEKLVDSTEYFISNPVVLNQKQILDQNDKGGTSHYVHNLNLFEDHRSNVAANINSANSSTIAAGTRLGATLNNVSNITAPEDASNTIWHIATSGYSFNASADAAHATKQGIKTEETNDLNETKHRE